MAVEAIRRAFQELVSEASGAGEGKRGREGGGREGLQMIMTVSSGALLTG
jgi:hypothetical protein